MSQRQLQRAVQGQRHEKSAWMDLAQSENAETEGLQGGEGGTVGGIQKVLQGGHWWLGTLDDEGDEVDSEQNCAGRSRGVFRCLGGAKANCEMQELDQGERCFAKLGQMAEETKADARLGLSPQTGILFLLWCEETQLPV